MASIGSKGFGNSLPDSLSRKIIEISDHRLLHLHKKMMVFPNMRPVVVAVLSPMSFTFLF